jgi:hypothetical protein
MTRLVLATSLILLPLDGEAVGPTRGPIQRRPTVESYARDLSSSSPAKRRYAARVLLRQIRTARRAAARGPEDDLTRDEARQTLTDCDRVVAPACSSHIALPEVTGPCADILGLLETRSALPQLKEQLQREQRRSVQRRIKRAITTIQAVKP